MARIQAPAVQAGAPKRKPASSTGMTTASPAGRPAPVYLVLDNDLCLLPIESQPYLADQTICRVPSLPFVQQVA